MKNRLCLLVLPSFALVLCLLSGCRKMDEPSPMPQCIEDKLMEFKKMTDFTSANLKLYSYQGVYVYSFDMGAQIADGTAEIVDMNCNTLGYLGGFSGTCIINDGNFCKDASLIEVIWER